MGRTVKLRGMAMDRKGGAVLVVGKAQVWIDDLHAWPAGYYKGGDRGRRITVTGVLDRDHGLPVFVEDPVPENAEFEHDGVHLQGIPVPAGTDLDEASERFVLRDAQW